MAALETEPPALAAASQSPVSHSKDPFVGNVSKISPHHGGSSKQSYKKGNLIFDACFEGGNLGRVDLINDFEYDLFIRPDTCNPRFRMWFNFTVSNVKSDQRVIFNIVNFSKTKSLYREGMSPLVKSTSRPHWQRIPSKAVFYYRCPDHQKNYVLSFAFAFDKEEDMYQFSYSFPYSFTRLQKLLDKLEMKGLDYFQRETICKTVQQRPLDLLTITHPRNLDPSSRARMVFITARVHPGESPASYVCQGLMEHLMSDTLEGELLRENIIFKIVPMLNPDGVYLGNYRSSLMGFDLNRHWADPSPWAQPTITATKKLVMEYDQDPNIDLDFYIDIHSHSIHTNGFMYGNVYDEEERFERQAVFPKLLAKHATDFSWNKTSFNRDAIKAGTGRRYLGDCLSPQTHCYTLEVSFFGYLASHSSTDVTTPYTEEAYLRLGQNLAKTFLDYYNLTHTTPTASKEQLDSQQS
ncbi:cytosolic carboxypeptidase 6-like isoform X2 [Halichondria panicea]|uniref:cytosolic carboxypeptidase 6-like isoform X2 n=1 Tax=Halichondria panicea TaxID=6063 RepID=UPI00312B794D